ncbi:hypothetical protein CAPTEDRAFT_148586 [Capitella teleta]|uniref:REST corepressor 3 n=1 Tax=Capitella teleta TaxID=283909 RepID=R7TZ84_CAPTE|nr:hypothetical protein CAPTEDRAFT_148586 [Capitella teleta]|eukprot:ELT96716.1 hypothetical protein CAPTEDRAFT_148586 [Capitella teleta]
MRVGDDYQVRVPAFHAGWWKQIDAKAEAMLVWAPHREVGDVKLDEYIHVAKEKHGYNVEQALGMLFWHKHSVDKALTDLANFTPFPDDWTVEDKVLFEQAFSFHGKSFHRIRQMLPDKSIASLVKYYYSWKKTRSRTSLMDRQARKLTNNKEESDEEAGGSGNSDSDMDSIKENGTQQKEEAKALSTSSSSVRTVKKADGSHLRMRKAQTPRGMFLQYDDLIAIATGPPGQGEALLKQLDTELVTLKRQVQNNKQLLGMNKQKTNAGVDVLRPTEGPSKINHRWSNEELLLAVQGVRRYGKNFKAIAEVIGNKSEAHVRSFFVNHRRRYNLDEVLAEYEKEYGTQPTSRTEEEMEIDIKEDDAVVPVTNGESKSDSPSPVTDSKGAPPPPLLKQSPPSKITDLAVPTTSSNGQTMPPLVRHA